MEEEVIAEIWERLCCYAPFDLSERKPEAITDIDSLEKQCALLEGLDERALKNEFVRVASMLPNYDDDPIAVVILPGDHGNTSVNERQNGVVGTSMFANILIQVNPLVRDYERWLEYVFAHEYHHTVWDNYWYVLHGGELRNTLIDFLMTDGEADCFAMEMYPDLKPQWLFTMSETDIERLWKDKYIDKAMDTGVDYEAYMFGNEEMGIPWCAGYAIGYMLVRRYLTSARKFAVDILELKPEFIRNRFADMQPQQ